MGGLFSSPKAPPPPPPPPPPTPLPDEDSPDIKRARRRKIAEQQKRSGRASTILSQGGDRETLGGS